MDVSPSPSDASCLLSLRESPRRSAIHAALRPRRPSHRRLRCPALSSLRGAPRPEGSYLSERRADGERHSSTCQPRRGPQARDLLAHGNLRPIPDERERVSSKGACDRRARTKSERRPHHASEPNAPWLSAETPTHLSANCGARNLRARFDERERVSSKGSLRPPRANEKRAAAAPRKPFPKTASCSSGPANAGDQPNSRRSANTAASNAARRGPRGRRSAGSCPRSAAGGDAAAAVSCAT